MPKMAIPAMRRRMARYRDGPKGDNSFEIEIRLYDTYNPFGLLFRPSEVTYAFFTPIYNSPRAKVVS